MFVNQKSLKHCVIKSILVDSLQYVSKKITHLFGYHFQIFVSVFSGNRSSLLAEIRTQKINNARHAQLFLIALRKNARPTRNITVGYGERTSGQRSLK